MAVFERACTEAAQGFGQGCEWASVVRSIRILEMGDQSVVVFFFFFFFAPKVLEHFRQNAPLSSSRVVVLVALAQRRLNDPLFRRSRRGS